MKNLSLGVFLASLVALLSACGGGGGGASNGATAADTTPPVAVVTPVSGSPINATAQIRITFSESMKTSSLVLGGSLAAEANGGVWSNEHSPNDTLTIAPQTAWSGGVEKTLTIDASDLADNPLSRMTVTYTEDTEPPTAITAPANGATINNSAQIVISFSEAMNTASLVLGGTMAPESGSGVWSTRTNTNDVLTISPTASWSGGERTLTVNALDLAANPMATITLSYSVDTSLPSASVSPLNGSALTTNQAITLTFTKSMDTASFVLGGWLAEEVGTTSWATTKIANDTLTITPNTQWSPGESRTLTINANDAMGYPMAALNLTYDAGIIFVSETGSDTNAGSKSAPLGTIDAALAKTGYPEVHVQGGYYGATVTITNGRTLKGSYDPSWTTADVSTTPTLIEGAASGSLIVQGAAAPVNISAVKVKGVNATTVSESSYAVRVLNSSGPVGFQSLVIVAGAGMSGANGANGASASATPAAAGGVGENSSTYSSSCDDSTRRSGGAGGGSGSLAGGKGGNGGTMDTNCSAFPPTVAATSGLKGSAAITYVLSSYGDGGSGGPPCEPGTSGKNGLPGQAGISGSGGTWETISGGLWVSAAGDEGTLGTDGTGGGGGGGSGGCDNGDALDSIGAGGGGGGAGGAHAPLAGKGGGGGGASFGMFIVGSVVNLSDSAITLGTGGNGGSGGSGGLGQPGGSGQSGGNGSSGSPPGGRGGNGGKGGDSGSGGGGAGGDVYGIYKLDSTVNGTADVAYSGGTAGSGGAGGNGISNKGDDGTVLTYN